LARMNAVAITAPITGAEISTANASQSQSITTARNTSPTARIRYTEMPRKCRFTQGYEATCMPAFAAKFHGNIAAPAAIARDIVPHPEAFWPSVPSAHGTSIVPRRARIEFAAGTYP
jgi:hypothetical protein